MNKYNMSLIKEEREYLSVLASKGEHKPQKVLNALILLGCDAGNFHSNRLLVISRQEWWFEINPDHVT